MIPPIVLLHAFPLAPEMFDDLRAESKFVFHAPALPGFGDVLTTPNQPSMRAIAQSVLDYADQHGLDRFIVGGVSLGGYVVMELMRMAPERLLAAALIDTKASEDTLEGKANRERIARLALRHGTNSLLSAMLPPLTGKTTKAQKPQVIQRISEIFSAADPAAIAWTSRAMATRPDSFATLRNFKAPLLVVVGVEDEISPVSDASRMAEAARFGKLTVINQAGHLAVMEQPAECARVIEKWLTTL